jgi:hypothetical protein
MKRLFVLVVVLTVALTTQIKINAVVLPKPDCSNVRAEEKNKCTPVTTQTGANVTVNY